MYKSLSVSRTLQSRVNPSLSLIPKFLERVDDALLAASIHDLRPRGHCVVQSAVPDVSDGPDDIGISVFHEEDIVASDDVPVPDVEAEDALKLSCVEAVL